MAVVDDLADDLAKDVLAAQDEMGNDRFYLEVAKVLSTLCLLYTSPSPRD